MVELLLLESPDSTQTSAQGDPGVVLKAEVVVDKTAKAVTRRVTVMDTIMTPSVESRVCRTMIDDEIQPVAAANT